MLSTDAGGRATVFRTHSLPSVSAPELDLLRHSQIYMFSLLIALGLAAIGKPLSTCL